MTLSQAKFKWFQTRTYRKERRKQFLRERSSDIVRLIEALRNDSVEKALELRHALGAVVEEMANLEMPEAEGLFQLLFPGVNPYDRP